MARVIDERWFDLLREYKDQPEVAEIIAIINTVVKDAIMMELPLGKIPRTRNKPQYNSNQGKIIAMIFERESGKIL